MPAAAQSAWPAADSYRYLDGAGPADLAWEWLRRDPEYRRFAHERTTPLAGTISFVDAAPPVCTARWGCLNQPDPSQSWRDVSILWSSAVDPSVLEVMALPPAESRRPTFDLHRCGAKAVIVHGSDRQHVLIRANREAVRLDVLSGSLADGSVALLHHFAGTEVIEPTLAALRRFLAFCRGESLPTARRSSPPRLRRHLLVLRVHDALAHGASIRDIGVMLFGSERVRQEWAGEALKSQCRRLIARSREMAAGGYRSLLLRNYRETATQLGQVIPR